MWRGLHSNVTYIERVNHIAKINDTQTFGQNKQKFLIFWIKVHLRKYKQIILIGYMQ